MPIRHRVVPFAVLAATAIPTIAWADTAADSQGLFVESVTVTAQKRAQNQIDVPMAITAYSGDFLEKIDVQQFDKLSLFVPGFVVQNQSPNNPGLVMRGLNLDSGEASQEPRVSVFEDDVSISTTRATYIELFDIERVEVVKGPQTTLFGRAALMGGVNVIQNKAKIDQFSAAVGFEVGDYNYKMIEGMANMPLSDTTALRVAGRYKARDGYVKNLGVGKDYNSIDTGAARAAFTWKPNEDFSIDIIANFEEDRPTGTSFKSGTFVPTDVNGNAVGTLDHTSGATLNDTVAGFENNKHIGLNRKVWDVKGLTTYKINPSLTLSTVTAYRRFDSEEVFDPDGFAKPLLQVAEDARGDQFSHEMRLNFDNGGRFSAFGGVNYFYSNVSQRVPGQFDEYGLLALLTWGKSFPQANTAFTYLNTYSNDAFSTAMKTTAPGMLADFLYPSVYAKGYSTAYSTVSSVVYTNVYNSLVGSYGPTIAAAQANAYIASTAGKTIIDAQAVGALKSQANTYGSAVAAGLKNNHWEQAINYGKTKAADVYLDGTFHVTDALEFDAGVRYTHDDKQTAYGSKIADSSILGALLQGKIGVSGYGLLTQPTVNNGDKIARDFSDDGLTWRLAARYAIDNDTSIYATYARGRRPKVLTAKSPATPLADPIFTSVPAEEVDSYEIGAKALTLDGTLRLDAAFYFYDYNNFQSTKLDATTNTFTTFNAGKAEAYGFEGTADWAMTEWADLFLTYTGNRARFVGAAVYQGDQFRLNPDHKLSAGLSVRQHLLGGTFNFLPTYTWQSKIFFDDNNDDPKKQDNLIPDRKVDEFQGDYGLLNLRLTYAPDGANWTVGVFVTNVFDRKYIKDAGNSGDNLGIPTFIAGEPRFFGASLSLKTH